MTGFVYFVRVAAADGLIKIGTTTGSVEARFRSLNIQSPVPLELLVSIPGDLRLEMNIHQCFADAHSHGEWFHPSPRLISLINDLQSGEPLAKALDLNDRKGKLPRKSTGTTGYRFVKTASGRRQRIRPQSIEARA